MESVFRFGIMGPGNIAREFCAAVQEEGHCEVAAVASRSRERAERFAEEFHIAQSYDSYEKMLEEGNLDAVYIAVTTNAHFDLAMLCLDHRMPFLCEKAMFTNYRQAKQVFDRAQELGVFCMEGMWSRFLPKMEQVKTWLREKQIGDVRLVTCDIGFRAEDNPDNRFYNPELGGGAAFDILVYSYEITTAFFEKQPVKRVVFGDFAPTGVDRTDVVLLQYPGCLAEMHCTFEGNIPEQMVFYGTEGTIVMPHPHYGKEAILHREGQEDLVFTETAEHGFIYEIREVMHCVRENKKQSDIAPHAMTLEACALYDELYGRS